MKFDEKIIVMALKGTPPIEPDTPPAFTRCTVCKADLVYDARNQARMDAEKLKPYCGPCAADLVFASDGRPTVAKVQGLYAGKDSDRGVDEFLDRLTGRPHERVH